MAVATTERRLLVAASAAALSCLAADAVAANPACVPIASAPYQIQAPGLYCLTRDLGYAAGSGAAILVMADDVTVDLNGFTLTGTAGRGTFAMGVYAMKQRGLTVRNGTIRGFLYGVILLDDQAQDWAGSGGHAIRGLQLVGNYFRGVRVEGRGDVVERCRIADTGGTTVFGAGNFAFGIEVFGPGAQLIDNIVDGTVAGDGGEAVGISISNSGHGVVVEGNVVRNDVLPANGQSFGVWIGGGSRVLLLDNRFTRLSFGAAYSGGTSGLFRDNAFTGCLELVAVAPQADVVDAGNNN